MRITDANRPWWTLVGACVGLFLLMLDSTVVVLALPSIQRELDASATALQWVQNAYLLVIAVLVVTLGRLGDMIGRRGVFLASMVVFAIGSVVSALAPTVEVLIAGRVVQGIGGAGLIALSLAITCNAFPAEMQNRAVGIWAAVSSLALAIGPLVGGALVDGASWRWIFWINLPIAVVGVAILLAAARESRDETSGRHLDLPGFALLSLGLTAVVLALIESQAWGWTSAGTLGLLGAGTGVLVAFWFVERRVSEPIVDFSLFRNGPYFGASAAGFALVGCYWSVMFFQPQYLQNVLDYSVLAAGVLILPITAPMLAISPFAGPLISRFGARALMTAGMLVAMAGLFVQTLITDDSGYGLVLPGYLLFGVALGLVYAPMSSAAMSSMPREKAGIASGVLAMNRVMAGALGLAITGAVFAALQRDKLSDLLARRVPNLRGDQSELDSLLAGSGAARQRLHKQPPGVVDRIEATLRETFTYALSNAFWVLVGLAAAGTVLTWLFVRSTPGPQAEPADPEHHQHHRRFHL